MSNKFLLILTTLSLLSSFLWSQVNFQRTLQGSLQEVVEDFQQTTDNGFIITGYTDSGLPGSQRDIFLVKTDELGNLEWVKTYGGTKNEAGKCVILTSDGGYLVAGKHEIPIGNGTVLIKTNSLGDTIWTQAIDGFSNSPRDINQLLDGGYLLSSSGGTNLTRFDLLGNTLWSKNYGLNGFQNTQIPDGNFMQLLNLQGPVISKLNSAGDTIFSHYITGSSVTGRSFQKTADGGYIICGQEEASTTFPDGRRTIVIKLDSTGAIEWQKLYGSNNLPMFGHSIVEATSDGYLILQSCFSTQTGQTTLREQPSLLRISATGNLKWCRKFEHPGFSLDLSGDIFGKLITTSDGGYFFSVPYRQITTPYHHQVFMVKTDSLGHSGCNETQILPTVSNANHQSSSITLTNNSIPININSFNELVSTILLEDSTFCLAGGPNGIKESSHTRVSIHPNPSKGKIYITLLNNECKSLTIINSFGQTIWKKENVFNTEKIEIHDFPPGFYTLIGTSKSSPFQRKFIIHR